MGNSRGASRLKQRFQSLTLKGKEGRWLRRALITVGVLIAAVILAKVLKPETQLMNSVEINRVVGKGMLSVAVRDDMPGFCEGGVGLEADLALLLAKRLLPDSEDPLKLVPCSSKSITTKLQDGSADVAIALQPKGASSKYSYSYPYYEDEVRLVTLNREARLKSLPELVIGYLPDSASGSLFASYVKKLTAAPEQNIIGKILGRPKPTQDPATAVTVNSVKYGSYDELLWALRHGEIDAAVMAGAYVTKYFGSPASPSEDYWLCDIEIGSLEYCVIASSDEPALTQIADMLIYEMQEDGSLKELVRKYVR
ncbi:MAG: transporter substrate-binding domain-containing protein [Clostridiales bacterium]|nr:transporter substrate-binding domain-containing protein [Clostridiales bacterium]